MNSTEVDQWCHQRRLIRERRRKMTILDYPLTLELGRYDPATDEEWCVGTVEVMAHIGPQAGGGWQLDGWSYRGSKYATSPPRPLLREAEIRATGTRKLDGAVEEQLKAELRSPRVACSIDIEWDRLRSQQRAASASGWLERKDVA